jgi:hypothetical protein
MNREEKLREVERLQKEIEKLKSELEKEETATPSHWAPSEYYTTYHVLAGMILGLFGAVSSLLFNIVGSVLVGQYPLQLIRVYLTFPLGEDALQMESGLAIVVGCGLYLATGMLLGIPFHIILTKYFDKDPIKKQFLIATLMGIGIWLFNYYAVLSWLQPLLFGGSWVVSMIPWWVGAFTHLVFAWTMLLIQDWGKFDPSHYLSK